MFKKVIIKILFYMVAYITINLPPEEGETLEKVFFLLAGGEVISSWEK